MPLPHPPDSMEALHSVEASTPTNECGMFLYQTACTHAHADNLMWFKYTYNAVLLAAILLQELDAKLAYYQGNS